LSERLQEQEKTFAICQLVIADPDPFSVTGRNRVLYSSGCQVLDAALFAAKTTLPQGSPRLVFIQDLAASLNRRRLLPNEKVEEFWEVCEEKINR
jgi:hypothetical protein